MFIDVISYFVLTMNIVHGKVRTPTSYPMYHGTMLRSEQSILYEGVSAQAGEFMWPTVFLLELVTCHHCSCTASVL